MMQILLDFQSKLETKSSLKQSLNKMFTWLFCLTTAILAFLVLVVKQPPRSLDGMLAKGFQLCGTKIFSVGSSFTLKLLCSLPMDFSSRNDAEIFTISAWFLQPAKVFHAWRGNPSWRCKNRAEIFSFVLAACWRITPHFGAWRRISLCSCINGPEISIYFSKS